MWPFEKKEPERDMIGEAIEKLKSFRDVGIARLSERVRELEADGYEFHRHTLTGEGRYGHPVRVTKYKLMREP